jgi:hypothetical protein
MKMQSKQTMSGCTRRRGPGFLAATLPAALLITMFSESRLCADTPTPNPHPLLTNTILLEPKTNIHAAYRSSISVSYQPQAFKKEPPVAGKVLRGILKFSDDTTNDVAFLWQRDAGKLFLDFNRNEDFTDDPAGVFSTALTRPLNSQMFTDVPLTLTTSAGRCTLPANLSFWDNGSHPTCAVDWRSLWQGKMTVAGDDWQVGIIPNIWSGPNGHRAISFEHQLLLRPWARRNEPVNLGGAGMDIVSLSSISQKLFFAGRGWQLSAPAFAPGSEFKPALKFAEQAVTLGDLKITGKFIRRLTMQGDDCLVVLDQPAETVKVPVGNYTSASVLLEQGGAQAFATDNRPQQGNHFTVTEKVPGTLSVGGPLTNSVAVTRHGQDLRMDYRLIGAAGQTYQLASQDRSHPPEFAIFKGDTKIASGSFEFG